MTALAALPATDRFANVIDALCRSVAARIAGRALPVAVIWLIWRRLNFIKGRVLALASQIRSGTLRRSPVPHRRDSRRRASVPVSPRLPRGFAWLLPLVPYEAAGYASQLRCVLSDPEMAALIAATPRMVRALRPLCHMLGLEATLLSPLHLERTGPECGPSPMEAAARGTPPSVSFSPTDDPAADPGVAGWKDARPLVPT